MKIDDLFAVIEARSGSDPNSVGQPSCYHKGQTNALKNLGKKQSRP